MIMVVDGRPKSSWFDRWEVWMMVNFFWDDYLKRISIFHQNTNWELLEGRKWNFWNIKRKKHFYYTLLLRQHFYILPVDYDCKIKITIWSKLQSWLIWLTFMFWEGFIRGSRASNLWLSLTSESECTKDINSYSRLWWFVELYNLYIILRRKNCWNI